MTNAVVIVNDALAFRFPKTDAARALQRYEAALLATIHPRLPVAVPRVEAHSEQFACYRLVPGEPLYRHRLLLAWLLSRPAVASVIVGTETPEELHANATAADVHLKPMQLDILTALAKKPSA